LALAGTQRLVRHTPYDLVKAAKRVRDTNYPQAEDFAVHGGLRPIRGGILEKFTQAELT
jgi:hypothetical protein